MRSQFSRNESSSTSLLLFLACAAGALGTTGCASLTFKPGAQAVGEYKNTARAAYDADAMKEHSAEDVKVLVEALPEGITVKDGVFSYDRDQYEMLGKVSADYKNPTLPIMGFWVYDYKEGEKWRYGLCTWQVPLSWVTLTLWAWVSPTYYPCRVGMGSDEERRADIVETLQRATKALGGNLVVVAGFGGVDFVTVNSHGAVVSSRSMSTLSGLGYAFKRSSRADAPNATPAGTTKL
jgi:hypothetical protein